MKILTPNARRRVVEMLEETFWVSERRACRVVGQHRSTQRLQGEVPSDDEQELRRSFASSRRSTRVGAGSAPIRTAAVRGIA